MITITDTGIRVGNEFFPFDIEDVFERAREYAVTRYGVCHLNIDQWLKDHPEYQLDDNWNLLRLDGATSL